MIMKRNRTELENELALGIQKIHESRKIKDVKSVAMTQLRKYFYHQKILQILNYGVPFSTLSDSELYHIGLLLSDCKILNIDLSEYFTDDEITYAVNDTITFLRDYSREVTFKNMQFNGDEDKQEYVGFISYEDIAVMFEGGVFNYNFATQRRAKIIKIRNKTERIATINTRNVNQIKEEVLRGRFEGNTITLNIRPTPEEVFLYSPTNGDLTIDLRTTFIDTIDGYHRINGIHKAWKENKHVKGSMIILIKHVDIPQARYFIAQEAKGTLNNQDDVRYYDMSSNMAKLISDINKYTNPNNILNGKITTGNDFDKTMIFYEVFAQSMDIAWAKTLNKASSLTLLSIKEFICDFYSMMYELFVKKHKVSSFEELSGTRLLDQMFMSGLLIPAHKMYNENDGAISVDGMKNIADRLYRKLETKDIYDYSYTDKDNEEEMDTYIKSWKKVY